MNYKIIGWASQILRDNPIVFPDILNESEESTVSSSTDEELPDLTPRTSYKRPRQDVEGMVPRSQVKKLNL